VAIAGDRFDGHDHVAAAAARGAALAIVERDCDAPGITTLRVASSLEALARLAAHHLSRWREATGGRVIALTGSAGKTTTKRAIAAVLESKRRGMVQASPGNLNNLIGVPMTVLAMDTSSTLAVLELGTNSPGEIGKLARMVRPDVAVLTLIAVAHAQGLGGIDGVAHEKTALFRELAPLGTAIGNVDDARVASALAECSGDVRIGYGTSADADYRIVARELIDPLRSRIELRRPDRSSLSFVAPLVGAAGALACAAAVAVAESVTEQASGAEIEEALSALATQDHGPGRMQARALASGLWILDDSYNANPASCRSSIDSAQEIARALGRPLVLVLGEMRELGDASASAHLELGEQVASSGARLLIAVGGAAVATAERARELGVTVELASDAQRAAAVAVERVGAADLVLVKGSRGVQTELVVAALERAHATRETRSFDPTMGAAS
jgi:UDP-N-acetylmuramoyl-tripeptide--D-alanyl-D-alanine ligase